MPSLSSKIRKQQKKERGTRRREIKKEQREVRVRFVGQITLTYEVQYENDRGRRYWKSREFKQPYSVAKENDIPKEIAKFNEDCEYVMNNESGIITYKETGVRHTKNEIREPLTPLERRRMRRVGAFMYDGQEFPQWDTRTDRCVYDYLIHRYGHIKGFKKTSGTYESLTQIFTDPLDEEYHNPLVDGVNTIQLERWCERHNISMYACDIDLKLFRVYNPQKRNQNAPSLMFIVANNHFYPIHEDAHRKGLMVEATKRASENFKSQHHYQKETETIKEDNCEIQVVDVQNGMDFMVQKIEETKTIPLRKNIKYNGKDVVSFKLGDIKYVINNDIDMAKTLCKNLEVPFKGQGVGELLFDVVEMVYPKGLEMSSLNPSMFDTLTQQAVKARTHYGCVNGYNEATIMSAWAKGNAVCCDINKHYLNSLYDPLTEWIKLDFVDDWEEYQGKLKLGLYKVETDDYTILHGNNIYSDVILRYAKKRGVQFTVKAQAKSSGKLEKDYFKKVIDKIVSVSGNDPNIYKFIVNMMSGYLGKHKTINHILYISSDYEQVLNWFIKAGIKDKNIYIDEMVLNGTPHYLFGEQITTLMSHNHLPIYIQMKDIANVRFAEMIREMGGSLAFRKTDCALTIGGKCPKLSQQWGGYKSAEPPSVMGQSHYDQITDMSCEQPWYDYSYINDSAMWKEMLEIVVEQGGLLITGEAGVGKTFAVKHICKKLGVVKRVAPTHKACLVIGNGATTLHSFLRLSRKGHICGKWVKEIKDKYDYVVIDEISMIDGKMWERLVELKRLTGLAFVLVGDPRQCPPIEEDGSERDYFNHSAVKFLVNDNRVELTKVYRYDPKLKEMLDDLNNINTLNFSKKDCRVNICYFNSTRKYVNNICNQRFAADHEEKILVKHIPHDQFTQDIWVYKGLHLISRITIKDETLFNNESYEVVDFNDNVIYCKTTRVDEDGNPMEWRVEENVCDFQKSFLIDYCHTTHKSQGDTIKEDYCIWDWEAMSDKLKYTALSRGTRASQVSFNVMPQKDTDDDELRGTIARKLIDHKRYDEDKGYKFNLNVEYIRKLYYRQFGCCSFCGCDMKTYDYEANDPLQLSIDRIDDTKGHSRGNVVLSCWGCNRNPRKSRD